ncbi:MAG: hypothetical protein D6812_17345 [Deltaproteobacteria bacterium]|nr:MAG: hypothetical protein D6812_17345 [Deltaproteobacteria bacterium]
MQRIQESFHLWLKRPAEITKLLQDFDRFLLQRGGTPVSPSTPGAERYLFDPGTMRGSGGEGFWLGIFAPDGALPGELGEVFSHRFGRPALHLSTFEDRLIQVLAYHRGEVIESHIATEEGRRGEIFPALADLFACLGMSILPVDSSLSVGESLEGRLDRITKAVGIGRWSRRFREAQRALDRGGSDPWLLCAYRRNRRREDWAFDDPSPHLEAISPPSGASHLL